VEVEVVVVAGEAEAVEAAEAVEEPRSAAGAVVQSAVREVWKAGAEVHL
jgi:hypothetical protein